MIKLTHDQMRDHLSQHATNFAAGIITKQELVDVFVARLIDFGFVGTAETFADDLPDDVAAELAAFLDRERVRGYVWRPLRIDVPEDSPRPSYRDGLDRLDHELSPVLRIRLGLTEPDDDVVTTVVDSRSDA